MPSTPRPSPHRLGVLVSQLGRGVPVTRLPLYAEVVWFSPPPADEGPEPDGRFADFAQHALSENDESCAREDECSGSFRTLIGQLLPAVLTTAARDALVQDVDGTVDLFVDTMRRALHDSRRQSLQGLEETEMRRALERALRGAAEHRGLDLVTPPEAAPKLQRSFPLGLIATDHVGYASFNLERLPDDVAAAVRDTMTMLWADPDAVPADAASLWVYPLGLMSLRFDALTQRRYTDDLVLARVALECPPLPPEITHLGLIAMQNPGLADWRVSPGSFATNPGALVGQEGCESLLPANLAEHEYYFEQVIGLPTDEIDLGLDVSAVGKVRPAVIHEYRLRLLPIGHSLGQIVSTFGLAPGESLNFAVIDWTRRDSAMRSESTKLDESLVHELRRDRVISETVRAGIQEWQSGSSYTGGVASSAGGAIGASGMGAAAGLSGGFGGSYSTTRGSRDLAADTVQRLSDHVAQAATSSRELNSTVVVQTAQAEHEAVETRTITNYNHSHALTILYYEVLRHYRLVTEFVRRRPAVMTNIHGGIAYFVSIPPTHWEIYWPTIVENRKLLESVLLDDRLKEGFDVVERRLRQQLVDKLFPPPSPPPPPPPAPPPQGPWFRYFTFELRTGGLVAEPDNDEDVHVRVHIDLNSAPWWVPLNNDNYISPPGAFVEKDHTYWFTGRTEPPAMRTIPWGQIEAVNLNVVLDNGDDRESDIGFSFIKVTGIDVDGNETVLFERDYASGHIVLGNSAWLTLPSRRPAPLPPPPPSPTPAQVDEEVKFQTFNEHLLNRRPHYERALKMNAPVAQRAFELASLAVGGGRTLLDMVENRPVDVLGDFVAYPCVDPAWADRIETAFSRRETPDVTPVERLIALPTRGVFTEAKLGHCNASEVIDNTRFWDWQSSPIPNRAPEIAPVQTVTPQNQPAQGITPSPFPASLVNIVNPPNAPDPSGMGAALTALTTSNLFRDMSGLSQTVDLLKKFSDNSVAIAGVAQKAAMPLSGGGAGAGSGGGAAGGIGGVSTGGYGARGATGSGVVGGARANAAQPSAVNRDLQDYGNVLKRLQADGLMSEAQAQDAMLTANDVANGALDLQNVDTRYVRGAYTPQELVALVGEQITEDALRAEGHIIFSDWRKHAALCSSRT